MKKFITITGKVLLYLLLAVFALGWIPYLFCPWYEFPERKPFTGERLYNPYETNDKLVWRKGNFQVQSRVWGGMTNGRLNNSQQIQELYRQLGYDIIVISDYQSINRFGQDSPAFIPTYEHGYGISKTHQVCLGSQKVNWLDYIYFQTAHQKQHIINQLRKNNEIITLAHPRLRNAYKVDEMRKLGNYDLMEVLNQIRYSIPHWDSALSSGYPVFILSNDDAHDIHNLHEVGRCCTFIHSPSLTKEEIVRSLKAGLAYGAEIDMAEGEDLHRKAAKASEIPFLSGVKVSGDTLTVEVSSVAFSMSFIGQGGKVRKTVDHTTTGSYRFAANDTYIRTEIVFPSSSGEAGTRFFLNPVFRYHQDPLENRKVPVIHPVKTIVYRGLILIFVLGFIRVYYLWRKTKKESGSFCGD